MLGCHGNRGAGLIWGGGVLGCHGNRGAGLIWGGGVLGCHGNRGAADFLYRVSQNKTVTN